MAFLPIGLPGRALNANVAKQSGAKLYVYDEGTTTPVTTYSDAALTTPQAHPIVADSDGIFAAVFVAQGRYKVTMTTSAGVTLPGFPIDGIGALVDSDEINDAVDTVNTALATYADRTALAAATVPAAVKRVYLQFHTSANLVGGHRMVRTNFADLSGFPSAAYTRSTDRYTKTGTTDATEGGYWVVDEDSPTVVMFGGIPNGAVDGSYNITGTDCSTAAQAWIDFYLARRAVSGNRYNHAEWKWGEGVYRLSSALNFTNIADQTRLVKISGWGATILLDGADTIPFDFTDAEYFVIEGFMGYGSPATPPLCFIKTGRLLSNNTAARWAIRDCTTRYVTAGESTFRIAALWSVASESAMDENCIWENYRDVADDTYTYAAAYDSCNWMGYYAGKTISGISLASECVVTATSHGYSDGDKVVFGEQTGTVEAEGRVYWVVDSTANDFKISSTDPATSTTYVNSSAWTAFSSGLVHKEKWASTFIGTDRLTPYQRHSMKHVAHVRNTYTAPVGRAGILLGACEDNKFHSCFAGARRGIHFVFEDTSIGFEGCRFDLHVEDGGGPGVVTWGEFERIASNTECTVSGCDFLEVALSATSSMFRVAVGDEDIRLLGGSITVPRFTSTFTGGTTTLFSSGGRFSRYGMTFILSDFDIGGTDLDNTVISSGLNISKGSETNPPEDAMWAVPTLQSFTVATLPDAGDHKHGIIYVTDEIGGATIAFSNGTNWKRVSDLATVS